MQKIIILVIVTIAVIAITTSLYYKNRFEACHTRIHTLDERTLPLIRQINTLATEIRIATYPGECDAGTKEIIGEACDLGNYMEWAGPELERETNALYRVSVETAP